MLKAELDNGEYIRVLLSGTVRCQGTVGGWSYISQSQCILIQGRGWDLHIPGVGLVDVFASTSFVEDVSVAGGALTI
jgi:hypothetical protein